VLVFFITTVVHDTLCVIQAWFMEQMDLKKEQSLLDSTHVWIMPQYVESRWWEIESSNETLLSNCSDSTILEILNRINLLVLDSIKYNVGGVASDYHGEYTLVSTGQVDVKSKLAKVKLNLLMKCCHFLSITIKRLS